MTSVQKVDLLDSEEAELLKVDWVGLLGSHRTVKKGAILSWIAPFFVTLV